LRPHGGSARPPGAPGSTPIPGRGDAMKKIINVIDRISGCGGWTAGGMMVVALAIGISEIVARYVFGKTLYIADEYSGYLMAMLTFIGLSYTLRERGHIRMMFLVHFLKGRSRTIFNMVCMLVGLVFCVGLVWFTGEFFWDSVVNRTQSMQITETYLAIPQVFLPIGSFFLLLQFLAEFLKGVAVLKNDTTGLRILEETDELGR